MNTNNPLEIINLKELKITFDDKPIIVGGMAMEYYGIRKHGDDIDFIVSNNDYLKLEAQYRNCRKDMWGDFGIRVNEYEMFRSMWKFDYHYFNTGSIEFDQYKIVSLDMLFRMKVFAIDGDNKHKKDVELLKNYFMQFQNQEWNDYMNKNIDRYLNVENGLIINGDYY
ncbi:MAG: hypothetical protein LBI04_08475 [Treponema sp.]|jgi:hypothetical protein|nr:hypothetical protein [Treponema sp.]